VKSRSLQWAGHVTGMGKQGMPTEFGEETCWKMATWKTEKEMGG